MHFFAQKTSLRWGIGAAAVMLGCFLVNVGGAWWEYGPATGWNLLATAVYVLFWCVFTRGAGTSPGRVRAVQVMAALSLLAAVLALLTRAASAGIWMVPALLLAPLSAVPMYGLRCFLGWDGVYGLCALLSALWLACGLAFGKKG